MKRIAFIFSAAVTGLLLSGCSSTGTSGGFADPNNLETSQQLQETHSQALRQGL